MAKIATNMLGEQVELGEVARAAVESCEQYRQPSERHHHWLELYKAPGTVRSVWADSNGRVRFQVEDSTGKLHEIDASYMVVSKKQVTS